MADHQSISELAYRLWVARGRPHGSDHEDWIEAERQLQRAQPAGGAHATGREEATDASLDATFPASDPPSSHLEDRPPANAAEKWSAAGGKPAKSDGLAKKGSPRATAR